MSLDALDKRVTHLEDRVTVLEVGDLDVLKAVVDMYNDIRAIERRFDVLEDRLPRIIAEAVAPLLRERD